MSERKLLWRPISLFLCLSLSLYVSPTVSVSVPVAFDCMIILLTVAGLSGALAHWSPVVCIKSENRLNTVCVTSHDPRVAFDAIRFKWRSLRWQ